MLLYKIDKHMFVHVPPMQDWSIFNIAPINMQQFLKKTALELRQPNVAQWSENKMKKTQ